jgi:SAM-dependent methyltransferase
MTESATTVWPSYVEALVRMLTAVLSYQKLQLRVAQLSRAKSGDRVVDLGAGPGVAGAWALGALGVRCRYTGLDHNPDVLMRADLEARLHRHHLRSLRVLPADLNQPATTWGVREGEFSAGISTNFWYLPTDPVATLREAAWCIRPGGRLVISTGGATGTRPDKWAVLREHLALLIPGQSAEAEARRATEARTILSFLEGVEPANQSLTTNPDHHFVDRAGLLDWADRSGLWGFVHYETGYGDPNQNHIIVLKRQREGHQ